MPIQLSVSDIFGHTDATAYCCIQNVKIDYTSSSKYAYIKIHKDASCASGGKAPILEGSIDCTPVSESSDIKSGVQTWLLTQNAVFVGGMVIDFTGGSIV